MTIKGFLNWKRWAAGFVGLTVTMALSFYFYTDYHLTTMYGGHTEVAEVALKADHPDVFAVTNINVLTPASDRFLESHTVLIRNGTIESVAAATELTDGIAVIDGKGMFLVPGYTDSHVHLWESENDLLLYVANGVTQIREMNGMEAHLRWKEDIAAGRLGPDMYVVAPQVATFGYWEGLFVGWTQHKTVVQSERQVERAVQSLQNMGYDAIKASSFLDAASYAALSTATRDRAIPLIGHIPVAVGLDEFVNSNQTEAAHVEELVKGLNREFGGYTPDNTDVFLDFVGSRSGGLADRLIKTGKFVTSTVTLVDSFHRQKDNANEALDSVELQYVNPGIAEGVSIAPRALSWLAGNNRYELPEGWSEERKQRSLVYWQAYAEAHRIVLASLQEQGVPIMAGTDANVPIMVPGFSLHDEMMALNAYGMSASQVLASATRVPARWMGWKTGEIREGFKANLVMLRNNPLEDIGAVKAIEMVIMNGRPLSRSNLDEMLRVVETANNNSRTAEIAN